MLKLIIGRAGYGKTKYVFDSIKQLVDDSNEEIVLIIPEQFSIIAEKKLLQSLGESKMSRVDCLSFSRLSNEIASLYGRESLPVLSNGAKAVLMKKAIESVSDRLELFKKNNSSNAFVNSVIKIYDEMKSCRVSCEDIIDASNNTERDVLSLKLRDLSLIIDAYDRLIDGKYLDNANELTRLYEKLLNVDYFKDKIVFIDGFSGFVAQEYKIIEVILNQAKNVYITFCTDSYNNNDKYNLFSYVNSNINILYSVASNAGVKIEDPKVLKTPYRFKNNELKLAEKFSYSNHIEEYNEENKYINLYEARNISDECDNVGMNISKLLREGYRADSIAIICRDLDKYNFELQSAFRKYNVPFYYDERQNITSQPLVMFVNFLLRSIIFSYRSDDIFSLLKTGLTSLDSNSINDLENYVFLWNINGSKWKSEFTQSTKGFVESISNTDRKLLDSINESREYIVSRLTKFGSSIKGKAPIDICKAIYYTLLSFSADEKLKELAISLDNDGRSSLAHEQGRVWDLLMDILDKLALVGGEDEISVKEFYSLFNLMVANEDLGAVPAGLDNVQLGSADRMRCDNPRVTFILGANEGEFPQSVSSSGLLSENDRIDLINNNFKLYSYGEILNAQERFFAYSAISSPSEKLFVSYRSGGKSNIESSIVTGLTDVFKMLHANHYNDKIDIDKIESVDNAFDLLSSRFNANDVYVSSLKKYFSTIVEYKGRLKAVSSLVDNDKISIKDASISTDLFKKDMYLSASRIEDYYNCAFRYYCKFGINARPRTKAEMDPMQTGTVIHYVLEQIVLAKKKDGLVSLSNPEIKILVDYYLTEFLKTKMGDSTDFTARFKYQFMRLSRMLVYVVERLRDEFSQSDFEPVAFELKIGNGSDKEPVKSKHIDLSDGGSIEIKGAVDRVDTCTVNNKTYLRVVDYKSGDKKFLMSDIMHGLNLQMFIYLFTVCDDKNYIDAISSGVLYMHSARSVLSMNRGATADDIKNEENSSFKMKGVVLNDEDNEIAELMEHDLKGKYIPVKVSSKSGISGNVVSLAELGRISRKIDSLVEQMGVSLHSGAIAPNPVDGKNHNKTCEYCDYVDVCKNYLQITPRSLNEMTNTEVLIALKEEEENG